MGVSDQVYRRVKNLTFTRKNGKTQGGIESREGELLTDPDKIKKRWTEYIQTMYDKNGEADIDLVENQKDVDTNGIGPDTLRD